MIELRKFLKANNKVSMSPFPIISIVVSQRSWFDV